MKMHDAYVHPIGCRKLSMLRLFALLASSIAILSLLYYVLAKFTESPLFLFLLIVILTVIRRALGPSGRMWALFITKDGAYGWVKESGIEYRTLFGKDFVRWSEIQQLEYSPTSGSIKMYLSDWRLPIQFGRRTETAVSNPQESTVLGLLKEKVQSSGGAFVEQQSGTKTGTTRAPSNN